MSMYLPNESVLFTDTPDPQKEESHMFSAEQLAETILNSIQKNVQKDFVLGYDSLDELDIWCYTDGEMPL